MYRDSRGEPGGARAARPTPSPEPAAPRAARHTAQRAVELGHHQAARAGRSGRTSTCTSSSTSSAATWSAGWWRTRRARRWPSKLIEETCRRQGIAPDQLTLHADRGSSMTSKPVALLLADLGVTKTHSRPHVSNDNPFSESAFKTLKYRPGFPERFVQHRARPRPRRRLLRLVQQRAPPRLARPLHAARRALRPRRADSPAPRRRPRRRVSRAPGALHARAPHPRETAARGLDQQARAGGRDRPGCSVNSPIGCLTLVDSFRGSFARTVLPIVCFVDDDERNSVLNAGETDARVEALRRERMALNRSSRPRTKGSAIAATAGQEIFQLRGGVGALQRRSSDSRMTAAFSNGKR